MRPSSTRFSDMPGRECLSASKWWGDNHGAGVRQRGIIQYSISPFQTKSMPNLVRNYVFNFYRRVSAEAIYFLVPFGIGYGIYTWGKARYEYVNSKAGHVAAAGHH
ncbi:ubiquinol--cytochrome-c reductase subunit 8 [Marasmius tenuissimus]|nr:ubiquinol--cytochrome-c reductase subunit 8 [Marasmius tenuissimus]